MLEAFVDYIVDTDPDVLTGWNFDDFDAPYFLDRLEELTEYDHDLISIDRLSRGEELDSGWGAPISTAGTTSTSCYAYKRTQFTELESYRLDAVGELELDAGKERYSGDIGDLWEEDPERLLEYNLRDVELCVEIDRKQDIIAFWDEVRTFVGCKLEDAPTPGDTVDIYVLHKVHGEFALPSKGKQESEDYEGGAVFDPITGVKENVTVLDLKSLYPMCMVTINASPETKVDPERYDGEMFRAPNGTHFQQEPDGMIREMVDELLTEREEKKSLRNSHDPARRVRAFDRQQAAVKVIMNASRRNRRARHLGHFVAHAPHQRRVGLEPRDGGDGTRPARTLVVSAPRRLEDIETSWIGAVLRRRTPHRRQRGPTITEDGNSCRRSW